MTRRRFTDLSPRTRGAFVALGTVQVALNVAAQIDITRRPVGQVRGSKLGWRLVSLIDISRPTRLFQVGTHSRAKRLTQIG